MNVHRIRVIPEGLGLQLSALQEWVHPGDLPTDPIERVAFLIDRARDIYAEAYAEAEDAARQVAEELGHLPPGVGFQPPSTLVVVIEEMVSIHPSLLAEDPDDVGV